MNEVYIAVEFFLLGATSVWLYEAICTMNRIKKRLDDSNKALKDSL